MPEQLFNILHKQSVNKPVDYVSICLNNILGQILLGF